MFSQQFHAVNERVDKNANNIVEIKQAIKKIEEEIMSPHQQPRTLAMALSEALFLTWRPLLRLGKPTGV